jgi:choline-glycine betaine transporter
MKQIKPLVLLPPFLLCGVIYGSSFGRTVLGGPKAKKLLKTWQMFAVVLRTNIAAGILFWGGANCFL